MGLLWYVKEGGMARPMSRAPSWSWAAVDGLISNDSLKGNTQFDTCGSAVLQTAELGAEKLMIKARVKPGTWHRAPSDRKLYYLGHRRSGTVRFQHDLGQYEPLTSDLSQGPEVQTLRDLRGFEVGYLVLDSESELPYEGSEVYCLGIVVEPSTEIERRAFNVPWATRGLALVKVTGETNQYQRVGYLELQRTPGGVSYPSSINPAKQRAEREPAPNIDVAGFFDDCEFSTITLV
ncbi:hypothetical protein B0A48_07750 [Cryoendolithus antarcticus]|uniref:Uncharacterized protein n=1 Tax=Cryoendolithus antarcticus TaxID=1507870 RepID=A0A1V8T7E6_9PEZI|nr:hypothetical protein B0A48_07750 [Cryoendolithus antarcticus]